MLCIEEVGVDPELMSMPMDTMLNLSRKLLVRIIIPLVWIYLTSIIFHCTFEYYHLVSRGYLVITLPLINFDETMPFPVIPIPQVLGCRQPKTPNTFCVTIPLS